MMVWLQDPVYAWLAAGALLIVFEALTMPGLGLFLGGLGAVCTALLIKSGLVGSDSTAAQFAGCFGFTILWTVLLWKPIRKFRTTRKGAGFVESNNLIGATAIVAKGGIPASGLGQVIWSGTVMNAELTQPASLPLGEGAQVLIIAVEGNTLKVVPK